MKEPPAPAEDSLRVAVLVSTAGLGFSAIVTQLSLLRELLGAFYGNELVLGICLGNWFLLMGAGSGLGNAFSRGRHAARLFNLGQLAVALIPLAQVAAVRDLRDRLFLRGEVVGAFATWLGSLALLLPYCLVAGSLLTLACAIVPVPQKRRAVGAVYLADCLGSVIGGGAFVFVLVPVLDHFALLCLPAFLNLALGAFLAWRIHARGPALVFCLVAAALAALLVGADPDRITTEAAHRGERVVLISNSPYGRLVVCENHGLLTFYENGVPVSATENLAQVEEAVHYAMCQRPGARRVLLIGGGVAGDLREILKYPSVSEVTYVELDPALLEAGRRLVPQNLSDPRVHGQSGDARRMIRNYRGRFDVVIVDLPDPSTSQINRYYTAGFYEAAHGALVRGGVLCFAVGHYENFVGPELARLLACAHRTVSGVFPNTVMIPGGRVFFLASDGALRMDIANCLEAAGIRPSLVNRSYLGAMLTADRIADLGRALAVPAEANTDLSPALYYYELRRWVSEFGGMSTLTLGLAAVLILAYLGCIGRVSRIIFAAGFAASGIEVVLLLGFQILYGSVYRQIGLVVTVFMVGLAAGAWIGAGRSLQSRPLGVLRGLGAAIALFSLGTPGLLRACAAADSGMGSAAPGQGLLLMGAFALAVLVGAQFTLAGACAKTGAAAGPASLFSADLFGAALGAILVSAILIPVAGVTAVCALTAALNAAAAALGSWPRPCRP